MTAAYDSLHLVETARQQVHLRARGWAGWQSVVSAMERKVKAALLVLLAALGAAAGESFYDLWRNTKNFSLVRLSSFLYH